MKVSKDEILFIYDSRDIDQRERLLYLKSLKQVVTRELDIQRNDLNQLMLADLAKKLNVSEKDLVRQDLEFTIGDLMDLNKDDFLDYLSSNITKLKTPIAVYHDHAKFLSQDAT
ncbi:hypothetical protein [Ekhidna sp.]